MATCLCAVLDQTTGTVRVTNAGHPPLLRLGADGSADICGGRDRAAVRRAPVHDLWRGTVHRSRRANTLVLFTDGLVERRGEPIDGRLELLAERASEAAHEGSGWCDASSTR